MTQPRLRVVPCELPKANAFVMAFHRHHGRTPGSKFCLAAVDEAGQVRGVVIVSRPVARLSDDGWTLEVSRLCTDGTPNACSALYAAARRVAKEMGYSKIQTYILEAETGVSLKAAGWEFDQPIRARSWHMPGRPRVDKTAIVKRGRWSAVTGPGPIPVEWPEETTDGTGDLFASVGASKHDSAKGDS